MFSSSVCLQNSRCCYFFFLLCSIPCVNAPHFLYTFYSQGTFRLFPGSDYDEQCCYEHNWAHFLVSRLSIIWVFDIYPKLALLDLEEGCCLIFWEITTLISKEHSCIVRGNTIWYSLLIFLIHTLLPFSMLTLWRLDPYTFCFEDIQLGKYGVSYVYWYDCCGVIFIFVL